jgi:hypothetical protein
LFSLSLYKIYLLAVCWLSIIQDLVLSVNNAVGYCISDLMPLARVCQVFYDSMVFWTMIMRQKKNRLGVVALIVVFVARALIFTTSSSVYDIANA